MRQELDDKLVSSFPLLYADRKASMSVTCMCWGFECGDGWFDVLWKLSSELEPLIVEWIEQHPEDADAHPRASQVKEKFGTLRFYMTHETEAMSKWIDLAEQQTCSTCEVCGQAGTVRGTHWLTTLCDIHAAKRES